MLGATLSVDRLMMRFGGLVATDNVTLSFEPGEVHAIIGPNGAGKSTLIAQLGGDLFPTSGTIQLNREDITRMPAHFRATRGIGRSYQITSIFPDFTALQNVALAVQASRGHGFRFWKQAASDPDLTEPARRILAQVGLQDRANVKAGELAHGEKRALELAIALAANPKILLLDEPMAGMGPDEALKVVSLLQTLKGQFTIILVEHDMDAVFALANRVSVLVYGRIVATGAPAEIRANAQVRQAYLGEESA